MTTPAAPATAPPVRVRGLDVVLGGRPVLQGVDLEVAAGEFVALLGTNGSGKSTLVRATVGLLPVAAGSVELYGTPVGSFGDWQRIGYVPQRSDAASGVPATVREVVTSGTLARRRYVGLPGRDARRAADEALETVGLVDRRRDSVSDLSGGQQQRVMIARALAGRCDLLVMDEPTAGVDHQSQVVLSDVLARLLGRGTTIWMVAHELGPLGDLVDRAVVLEDGRVVHDGPHRPELTEAHDHHHQYSPNLRRPRTVEHRGVWG